MFTIQWQFDISLRLHTPKNGVAVSFDWFLTASEESHPRVGTPPTLRYHFKCTENVQKPCQITCVMGILPSFIGVVVILKSSKTYKNDKTRIKQQFKEESHKQNDWELTQSVIRQMQV